MAPWGPIPSGRHLFLKNGRIGLAFPCPQVEGGTISNGERTMTNASEPPILAERAALAIERAVLSGELDFSVDDPGGVEKATAIIEEETAAGQMLEALKDVDDLRHAINRDAGIIECYLPSLYGLVLDEHGRRCLDQIQKALEHLRDAAAIDAAEKGGAS